MIVNQSDLDSFHHFASRAIAQRGEGVSFEELVEEWRAEQEREDTIKSVQRGVEEADAGRVRRVAGVDEAIREKLVFPDRRR